MKITKATLKQIIKEELEALNEGKAALGKLAGSMVPDRSAMRGRAVMLQSTDHDKAGLGRVVDDGARVLISDLQERVVELEMKILRLEDRGPQSY